jgi:hypothetical protein
VCVFFFLFAGHGSGGGGGGSSRFDILGMLISIYGSKELFVNEYRVVRLFMCFNPLLKKKEVSFEFRRSST